MSELLREVMAHQELARQGSVMTKPQVPEWRRNSPLLDTILTLIDRGLEFGGPQPTDAGNLAGIFRTIGLQRVDGSMSAPDWLAEIMAQPRYERFKQLTQSLVRRGLGDEFQVFRGKAQTDPLMKALTGQGDLPPVVATSLLPDIADFFARVDAEKMRKPAMLMRGTATPEAVPGLLPRRMTHGHEREMIVMPEKMPQKEIAARVLDDPRSGIQYTRPRDPMSDQPPEPIDNIIAVLLGRQ
jgi:hypothetical protein